MKTKTLTLLSLLFFVLCTIFSNVYGQEDVSSQEDKKLTKIETRDGNEFVGTVLSEDSEKIVLKTETFGELTIKKEIITKRTEIDSSKMVSGVLWDDNPQATRYLWTPNGYGLKKGEGYYQNIWVLYNQFSLGVSDNFSLSAGIIPLFFFGADISPVWIVPKFSIPIKKDKVNLSAGAFVGIMLGEQESGFGIVFSTFTYGNRDQNVNVGVGWGYAGGDWADKPILNLSAMARITSKGYFLTENYLFPDLDMVLLSCGVRYMAKSVGIDFGLYLPISSKMGDLIAIPIVGVTIPFGNSPKNI